MGVRVLEPALQPKLYEIANALRERMGLSCGVTLYQAQTGNTLNAALAYLPGEAHVILAGPLAEVLAENEIRAVLAQRMQHAALLVAGGGAAADIVRDWDRQHRLGLVAGLCG